MRMRYVGGMKHRKAAAVSVESGTAQTWGKKMQSAGCMHTVGLTKFGGMGTGIKRCEVCVACQRCPALLAMVEKPLSRGRTDGPEIGDGFCKGSHGVGWVHTGLEQGVSGKREMVWTAQTRVSCVDDRILWRSTGAQGQSGRVWHAFKQRPMGATWLLGWFGLPRRRRARRLWASSRRRRCCCCRRRQRRILLAALLHKVQGFWPLPQIKGLQPSSECAARGHIKQS